MEVLKISSELEGWTLSSPRVEIPFTVIEAPFNTRMESPAMWPHVLKVDHFLHQSLVS